MPPFHLIDPTRLAVELVYTLIVVFLCFTIYYKTREIFGLTKHEGIKYFRITFLFFGLAYISRFISVLLKLMVVTFDIYFPIHIFGIFPLLFIGYFSTMAILSLTYSILWKKLHIKHTFLKHTFLLFNVIAVLISGIAFFSRSPSILILAQAVLLIFTSIIIAHYIFSNSRKISRLYILYILFFLFWIVNLIALGPRRLLPIEIQTVFQVISIAVIGIIYYKVAKWT
jgi:hypothetical protein